MHDALARPEHPPRPRPRPRPEQARRWHPARAMQPRVSIRLLSVLLAAAGCGGAAPAAIANPGRAPVSSAQAGETPDGATRVAATSLDRATSTQASSKDARREQNVAIRYFDCAKLAEAPGERGARLGPGSAGIRAWNDGGPGGAAWNAAGLDCTAVVSTTCSRGSVALELRVGTSVVARQTELIRASELRWQVGLEPSYWRSKLDDPEAPGGAPYRTALFRLSAYLTCYSPYALAPNAGPRPEFAADDGFVAGFADGE